MKYCNRILSLTLTLFACTIGTPIARAEKLNLGTASTGQSIILDTASISRYGANTMASGASFTYWLGQTKFNASAHCGLGQWESGGSTHKPQSQATENMLSIVCSVRSLEPQPPEDVGYVLVFDPPTNIRATPNGNIICTLDAMVVIDVEVESQGDWYSTPSCGGGWIHKSQFRPFY